MQTIVNLVSAGLGVAWVPQSVQQFQRPGVVYRALPAPAARGKTSGKAAAVPLCETSLVWRSGVASPPLQRFVASVEAMLPQLR